MIAEKKYIWVKEERNPMFVTDLISLYKDQDFDPVLDKIYEIGPEVKLELNIKITPTKPVYRGVEHSYREGTRQRTKGLSTMAKRIISTYIDVDLDDIDINDIIDYIEDCGYKVKDTSEDFTKNETEHMMDVFRDSSIGSIGYNIYQKLLLRKLGIE